MNGSLAKKKFGIDLGTTFSSIGWFDPDTRQIQIAELVDAANGQMLLPSAVFIDTGDNIVVGAAAVHAGLDRPDRLIRWFKREIGVEGVAPREVDGHQWTPVDCSAEILKTLKHEAEIAFATEVKDVVITYPAYFSPLQKDLTRDAALKAGLNVIRMIEEPQAAALAYVLDEIFRRANAPAGDLSSLVPQIIEGLAGGKGAVLVYDLGGGTFDVAMVQAWGEPLPGGNTELHIKTLFNEGDIVLGGKDWDDAVRQLVADLDQAQNGHNPLEDPAAGALDDACESAKKDLARVTTVKVVCPTRHQVEISRTKVEEVTAGLLERTRQITGTVLARGEEKFGVKREDVTVLLCGGMTRWPAVRDMLAALVGRPPLMHKNPDFLVTRGAAYLAYLTLTVEDRAAHQKSAGPEAPPPAGNVIPVQAGAGLTIGEGWLQIPYVAIGVAVVDPADPDRHYVQWVMPSKSKASDVAQRSFATAHDGQTSVDIAIYFLKEQEQHTQDETDLAAWREYKTFTLTGVPPRPRGQKVHVELRYEEGGVIAGKAWDEFGNKIDIAGRNAG